MSHPTWPLRVAAVTALLAGAVAVAPAAAASGASSYFAVSTPTTGLQVTYGHSAKVTATLRVNAKTVRKAVPVGLYATPSTQHRIASGTTDRYGRVSFTIKPTASERIWFYAKAFGGFGATKFAWARLDVSYQPTVAFSLAPAAVLDNGDVVTMSATVMLNGHPRPGSVVNAVGRGGTTFALGTSDKNGRVVGHYAATIEWLTQAYQAVTRASSRCWKDAWGQLCETYLSARSSSTPTLTVEHPLTVDGAYHLVADPALPELGQQVDITATVTQSTGDPWPGLQLRAIGGGTQVWSGTTDAQGHLAFNVTPTRDTTYYLEPAGRYAAYSSFPEPEWLFVPVVRGHYTTTITMAKPFYGVDDTVDGTVTLHHVSGASVASVLVRVSGPDGLVASGRTDANGTFVFHDTTVYALGPVVYAAEPVSPDYVFDSSDTGQVFVTPTRLDYQLSATADTVPSGATVTINGTVTRSNGGAGYAGPALLCATVDGTIPGTTADCFYSNPVTVAGGTFSVDVPVGVDPGSTETFQLFGDDVNGPVYETTQPVTVTALAI